MLVFSEASLQRLSWSGFHNDTSTCPYSLIHIYANTTPKLQDPELSTEAQQYIHQGKLIKGKSKQVKGYNLETHFNNI